MKRAPAGRPWRFLAQDEGPLSVEMSCDELGCVRLTVDAGVGNGEQVISKVPVGFDELVVGKWLHVEQMDDRTWWMCVGDTHIWVTVASDGTAKRVTIAEGSAEDVRTKR